MSEEFYVYDADQVSLIIAGYPIDSGYADGEFLRIERDANSFDDVVGTDGGVTRSKTNDKRATVRVLLMQTSRGNGVLSTLHNIDLLASNGAGVGPFLVRDRSGLTVHEGVNCWIQKPPDASFDRTATSREWVIRVAHLHSFEGGN